jgi:diguanylate cyclase (GGDEF)-like protein
VRAKPADAVDIHTLFLAQTCLLALTAAMLWAARSDTDRRDGLRAWTFAITFESVAYLVLAWTPGMPPVAKAIVGNAAGAASVALAYVAIRQFAGRPWVPHLRPLAAMVAAVTAVAALAGERVATAAIFNGFVYAVLEFMNAEALWRAPRALEPGPLGRAAVRVQRIVASCYLAMGVLLPVRAAALIVAGTRPDRLELAQDWHKPIYLFGFLYIVVTKLGFVLMCKMRSESEARLQAYTDELTTLPNRRAFDGALELALATAARNGRAFAVVMADIDRFKAINDTFGHRVGDAVLRSFAERVRAALRAQDRAFRYGGEEFCMVLPDSDAAGARHFAERLRTRIAQPATPALHELTASFGVAVWQPGDDADSLLGRADRALYRAKESGRDRVEIARGTPLPGEADPSPA